MRTDDSVQADEFAAEIAEAKAAEEERHARGVATPSPGPWTIAFDHPTSPTIGHVYDAKGREVTLFVRGQNHAPIADANLVAAAPELLDALIRIATHHRFTFESEEAYLDRFRTFAQNAATDAIAKTEKGTPC